ncbi:MAG: hypothetical protein ACE5I9_11590 [Candidatus Methylomirabilales bacterium]
MSVFTDWVNLDLVAFPLFYPELAVWGASARGPLWGGIGNAGVGYHDSLEDRSGRDPAVENSSIRRLAGYSREAGKDFAAGLQYDVEQMPRHNRFVAGLAAEAPRRDEFRHLLTLRLTKLLWRETLTLSLFTLFSPSDEDFYFRPSASYKVTDNLKLTAGAPNGHCPQRKDCRQGDGIIQKRIDRPRKKHRYRPGGFS